MPVVVRKLHRKTKAARRKEKMTPDTCEVCPVTKTCDEMEMVLLEEELFNLLFDLLLNFLLDFFNIISV